MRLSSKSFSQKQSFRDLDEWSSLNGLAILNMIDKKYGVKVTASEVKGTNTIQELFDLVASKK